MKLHDTLKKVDQHELILKLEKHYEKTELAEIELLVKEDLKTQDKMYKLIDKMQMNEEDFFFYLVNIFSKKLFNKMMLKKIRKNLK